MKNKDAKKQKGKTRKKKAASNIYNEKRWKWPCLSQTGQTRLCEYTVRPGIVSRFSDLLCRAAFIELNNAFYTRQGRTRVIIQAKEMRKGLASVRKGPPVATAALSTSLARWSPRATLFKFYQFPRGKSAVRRNCWARGLHTPDEAQCQLNEKRACERSICKMAGTTRKNSFFFRFFFFLCVYVTQNYQ